MSLIDELIKEFPESEECVKAFAAGWDAFLERHGALLIVHGQTDFRPGFKEALQKYLYDDKERGGRSY